MVAVVCFLAINIVTLCKPADHTKLDRQVIEGSAEETRQAGPWIWWVARGYLARQHAPDLALLGSSQMAFATYTADAVTLHKTIDPVEHRSATTLEQFLRKDSGLKTETYNFAMSGSMASDALLISRAFFHSDDKPKMVVIGINPRDFIDNRVPSISSTEPFIFLSQYVPLDDLSSQTYNSPLAKAGWMLDHALPMKQVREKFLSQIESLVPPGSQKCIAVAETTPEDKLKALFGGGGDVKRGDFPVISDTWIGEAHDNTAEYTSRYRNPTSAIYKGELAYFDALLADLQAKHIAVLVVGMPSLQANRTLLPETFWQSFNNTIASKCDAHGADWFDLSDNTIFKSNDYLDYAHLNSIGGRKLFASIATHIAGEPRLASALTGSSTSPVPSKTNNEQRLSEHQSNPRVPM